MTTLGGTGYDNLLVATNDNGLIDYSFIDMTTSKSGNKLVQTLDSGLININLLPTSTTGANNKIPITTSGNVLSNTWLNTTNGTGTLAAGKVVVTGSDKLISNNLLNTTDGSTTTESANSSKIVKTTTNGKINDNLLKTTKSGGSANANTIVKLDSNGLLDPSLFRNDQFIPLTGGEPSGNILVTGPNNRVDNTLDNLKTKYPNFYGFGANAYTDGFLIGINSTGSTNAEKDGSGYLVIATHDNGSEPIYVRQYKGYQGYTNMPDNVAHEITLMDKDGYTNINKLISSGDIITTDATKTSGNLTIAGIGESSIAGTLKVAKGITIPVTSDKVVPTNSTEVPLLIGSASGIHLEIDHNEIQAKYNATTPSGVGTASQGDSNGSQLVLQADGGLVSVGNHYKTNFTVNGNISTTNSGNEYKVNNVGNKEASKGNLTIAGTSYLKDTEVGNSSTKSNLKVYGTGYFYNTTDTSGTTNNKPALIIGGTDTTAHIEIDNNEIQAKASGTTTGTLGINIDGGNVSIGNDAANSVVTLRKNTSVTGTLSVAGNTTIGSTNTKSTLKVFGGVTADNGLTVNNSQITIDNGGSLTSGITTQIRGKMAVNDHWRIASGATASNSGYVELATADDGIEPIYIRQYKGDFATLNKTLTLLDGNGNTSIPGNTTIGGTLTVTGTSTLSTVDAGNTTIDRLFLTTINEFNGTKKATFETIKLYNVDNNGTTTFIGGNGATIVGGGEAAQELYNAYNSTKNAYGTDGIYNANNRPGTGYWSSDNLVLTADGTVYIHSNVQGNYNNRKEWIFNANGTLTAPGAITADNFNGKWGGVTNQITTHDTAPDLTRWMLTYVDGYVRYITMSEMADKMKSTITSGIDLSSRLPMPSLTTSAIGYIFTGYGRYHTLPSGGTWFWWACCFNANSTSIGPKWGISSGGSEIDLEYDNRRAHFFAMRIKST